MRLLNVDTMEFKQYFGHDIPKYAILSHTWEKEEVTFQDFSLPRATSMAGYAKIEGACKQAIKDRFEFIWIDTCCTIQTHHR